MAALPVLRLPSAFFQFLLAAMLAVGAGVARGRRGYAPRGAP